VVISVSDAILFFTFRPPFPALPSRRRFRSPGSPVVRTAHAPPKTPLKYRAFALNNGFVFVLRLKGPPQPGQPFKFTVGESCDRIKEEFNFLQAQYHT